MTTEWIERWASDLATTARYGNFWNQVGRADSILTAAFVPAGSRLARRIDNKARRLSTPGAQELRRLLKTDLETVVDQIAAAFLVARTRGRIREWNSVVEHAQLMHDIAQACKHPDEAALATLAKSLV
jgi:hypothetical protein